MRCDIKAAPSLEIDTIFLLVGYEDNYESERLNGNEQKILLLISNARKDNKASKWDTRSQLYRPILPEH